MELHQLKLPSGSILKYNISTFDNGDHLYRAIIEEAGSMDVNKLTDIDETLLLKVVLKSLSSKKIKEAVWACFDKAIVDGEKLTKEYFEPASKREDYMPIVIEITKVNMMPFWKSLCAQFLPLFQQVQEKKGSLA